MMTVEPTCRFCHRKMIRLSDPDSQAGYYAFECKLCDSIQFFGENARAVSYSFNVNKKYTLDFMPLLQLFQITNCRHNDPNRGAAEIYLTLNYIPTNITPQNITEEKIKLWILFS
jgi:hypothetical protein